MAQDRILLAETSAWNAERVLKHAGSAHIGNPVYQVATSRWVFPVSGVSEFRSEGRHVLLDGLTVLILPTGLSYQIREWHSGPRSHVVVSKKPGSPQSGAVQGELALTLAPRALWELRRHWRTVERSDAQAVMPGWVLSSVNEASRASTMDHPAVMRARRFMATRSAQTDSDAWSLHDVADAAYCSYFHLARLFRMQTGVSLHAYRERLRLAMALERLDGDADDLAGLANELGYSS